MPERIATKVPQSSRSWVGSAVVILGVVFLLLTLNEGGSTAYQPFIDSLFHNWLVTGAGAIAVWLARREAFGPLPSRLRGLSTVLAGYFALFSSVGLLMSQTLWNVLRPFGVIQDDVQPAAVLGLIWLWGIFFLVLVVRGVRRRFRKRYEHHGLALGFGPVYFYFRRRRTS